MNNDDVSGIKVDELKKMVFHQYLSFTKSIDTIANWYFALCLLILGFAVRGAIIDVNHPLFILNVAAILSSLIAMVCYSRSLSPRSFRSMKMMGIVSVIKARFKKRTYPDFNSFLIAGYGTSNPDEVSFKMIDNLRNAQYKKIDHIIIMRLFILIGLICLILAETIPAIIR